MQCVPVKTQEQQGIYSLRRLRNAGDEVRAALVSQIRGLLTKYGGITAAYKALPEILEDGENCLTPRGRACFVQRRDEQQIVQVNQEYEVCRRLDEVAGIGLITATATYAAAGTAKAFHNGRHFSAWLGLGAQVIFQWRQRRCWESVNAATRS